MVKLYKLFEIGYLVMAAIFLYTGISNWTENRTKAYMGLFLGVLAILVFFFKRNFRKKRFDN